MANMLFSGSTEACEEFLDLVIGAGQVAMRAAKNVIADLDALDRWENEGGACVESV